MRGIFYATHKLLWDLGSPNPGQKTGLNNNQQQKRELAK